MRNLKRAGVPFVRVSPEQFRTVSETERASGVAVILRQQILKLDQLKPAAHFCWIALSDIRSPGNFGTLVRTAAATGAGGFILIGENVDPFDPNVVRATMGALFKQQFARAASVEEFAAWAKARNLQVVGASPGGAVDYDEFSYQSPTVLMLGNEQKGLTANEQRVCSALVRIPMTIGTDSLNVAVAGSLLLYEVFRRARQPA